MDFDQWYEHHYRAVVAATAVALGVDPSTVEDAVADAFVKALVRWDSVSTMESPIGWVTTVAINNGRRSFRKILRLSERMANERQFESKLAKYGDPDLVEALRSLTHRQRRALLLHHLEGLTQDEVAEDLGVAYGTASATLAQARRKIRAHLELETK